MTWLELLQQDPAAFVLTLIVSLVITLVAYGAFPLIFAMVRNETITKKKYQILCFAINFIVMVVFIAINGEPSSGGPYALWTWAFSILGIKTLKSRGVLEGFSSNASASDKVEKSSIDTFTHETKDNHSGDTAFFADQKMAEWPTVNISPLLKRAFIFLEDGEFGRADEFLEHILNQDPENAQAYLGKLMIDLKVNRPENLADCGDPFDTNRNYQRAIQFADVELAEQLKGYIVTIKEKNRIERERLAEEKRVADEKARLERQRQAEIDRIEAEKRAAQNKKTAKVVIPIVAAMIVFVIILNSVIIPNSNYNDAVALMDNGKYEEAIAIFEVLDGYKDSAEQIDKCMTSILDGKYNNAIALLGKGDYAAAHTLFRNVNGHRDSEEYLSHFTVVYDKVIHTYTDRHWNSYTRNYTYSYDKNGNLIREDCVDSNGSGFTCDYIYNNNRLIKKVCNSDCDDFSDYTSNYTYDNNGNLTKEIRTYSDGKTDTYSYTYNSNGNVLMQVYTNLDGNVDTYAYIYDNEKLEQEICTYSNGYVYTYYYTYDSNGNVTRRGSTKSYKGGGSFKDDTFYYTYDEEGNLIKQTSGFHGSNEYQYSGKRVFYTP